MANPNAMSEAIREAYKRGEEEETMEPLVKSNSDNEPIGRINDGDGVIFYDLRGEREIELTRAFVDSDFDEFDVDITMKTHWATMIEYDKSLNVEVAFPPKGKIQNTLTEIISNNGMHQAKVSESEKSIHLNHFFNGKRDETFPYEDKFEIESPDVENRFDEKPEMRASDVADKIIDLLDQNRYDFIVSNFANVDVVGHLEDKEAIEEAIGVVDQNVYRTVQKAREEGYFTIVTSDHGTVEKWYYEDGTIDTGHTNSPVPFVCIPPEDSDIEVKEGGSLIDVAPTILHLLGLHKPDDITGSSLLNKVKQNYKVNLIITDGWGYQPPSETNLISQTETPKMDALRENHPSTTIKAAGEYVGLPEDTVGNSEAGHTHLGAGRVIKSDKVRVNESIEESRFLRNNAFLSVIDKCRENNSPLHIMGIISFFSSHGSIDYLIELLKLAKIQGLDEVYVHGFLGRRGEKPESGAEYTKKIEDKCAEFGVGDVVSIIGRYWALDREENWDRVEKTYRLLVEGEGRKIS